MLTIPDSPSLDIVNEITLAAWVKKEQYIDHGKVVIKRFDDINTNPWELYALDFKGSSPGSPCFIISDGSLGGQKIACNYSYSMPSGDWHHIAGTYNGSLMSVYVDGNLLDTTVTNIPIGTNDIPFTIGARL